MKKYMLIVMFVLVNVMAQTPLGTEFTYQGELKDNLGNPLTGQYDFKFVAFDTLNDGTGNLLVSVTLDNVQVTNGVFTSQLDLGSGIFIGDKVWLEISVRVGTSSGGYTQLLPRQQVTATPYATHAQFVGADAISDLEIQDGSITAADLGVGSVGTSEISANAVGTSEIDSTQVQRRVSASCGVGEYISSINENGTLNCVSDNTGLTSVTSANIVDGTIQTVDLANNIVTSAKIADATIQSIDLSNASVLIGKLAFNSVDSNRVVDESITAIDIAPNAVGTSEIITTQVQNRVIGQCLYPEYVKSIAENGDLICARIPVGAAFILNSGINDVGSYSSIAIGTDNLPIISYLDSTNGFLVVEKCTTPSCSSFNSPVAIDFGGQYTSIAIGADGNPIISYYNQFTLDLKVFKCSNNSCNFGSIITLDTGGDVGSYTSIAIGTDNNPIISYHDNDNGGTLKTLKCSNPSCSNTVANIITTVDSGNVGVYTSIAIGADGNPIISYYDSFGLSYVKCNNQSCSSHEIPLRLDYVPLDSDSGQYTSIALGTDGHAVISYYDRDSGNLKVYQCSTQLCSNVVTNKATVLDQAGDVGLYTSIAIGSDGYPVVSYFDQTNENLKFIKCLNQSCEEHRAPVTLDLVGSVGQHTSIVLGADNKPIISYYDISNGDLKVYSCGDEYCSH